MAQQAEAARRAPLNRERVLRAAVALADEGGIESLSMRRLAQELGVVPMALYKHVANKEQLLDGMVDAVVADIDPPVGGSDWKDAVRGRVLSARRVLLRHRWASRVIESRTGPTPAVLEYLDSMIGTFRDGGFSVDLTHHAMHAMGSRLLGFSQELFDDSGSAGGPDAGAGAGTGAGADALAAMAARYPRIAEVAAAAAHDGESAVGRSCDDQFEFEFALDLLLEGLERLHRQGWTSAGSPRVGG
ncbi:TetR/AcrR family transcriptional regulator C-terminal domain-containing protein [Streptomyces sp. NBC_01408]|uniref:TetR/AcrR family transcriptional regulator C-terminal domain-containing protein n=1 Tax=Streptomyces sp. NBC_01408 TaxID=2903855 RepID=UPI0022508A20|nr:TetR/AcrR family transcriptional regulator C-terminal domain-containing protein [Streptomyces sp. NBC_01408]MCX4696091.1 TetR/AcrR family transcriptional regulator C-terminal domain-containing protein [Streptomyces sp. NBC_01408]